MRVFGRWMQLWSGRYEYLVKFKGWSDEHNLWYPEQELRKTANNEVEEYEREHVRGDKKKKGGAKGSKQKPGKDPKKLFVPSAQHKQGPSRKAVAKNKSESTTSRRSVRIAELKTKSKQFV